MKKNGEENEESLKHLNQFSEANTIIFSCSMLLRNRHTRKTEKKRKQ